MYQNKPICFFKEKATKFDDISANLNWYQFNPDLSAGKVKDKMKAGMLGLKLYIHDHEKYGQFDYNKFCEVKIRDNQNINNLRCAIY